MKDTAYFNAVLNDADMMIINAMIRISSSGTADGYDAHGNELNDNTMINRVQNADYGKYIVETYYCNGSRIANPWTQTREYHHDSPG